MELDHHVITSSRYAAEAHCRRMARDAALTASRMLAATSAERARLDAEHWLDLASMINAMRQLQINALRVEG
jgi:hypothetical protein